MNETSKGSAESVPLFDVVAVNIQDGTRRVIERDLTARNADAYIKMAVYRRGVETEFFVAFPAGETP